MRRHVNVIFLFFSNAKGGPGAHILSEEMLGASVRVLFFF